MTYDDDEPILFQDKVFVITGDIVGYTRTQLQQTIESRGGQCLSAISRKVDYLVVGMQNKNMIKDVEQVKSSKIKKAELLRDQVAGIRILSDEFFLAELEDVLHV